MKVFVPTSIRKQWEYRAAKKRAQELQREFYGCTDPDKALKLIQQLCDETTEHIEKGVDPNAIGEALLPAWVAATEALQAVEKHLAANPDPVRQKVFDIIKEALNAPDQGQTVTRIILPTR